MDYAKEFDHVGQVRVVPTHYKPTDLPIGFVRITPPAGYSRRVEMVWLLCKHTTDRNCIVIRPSGERDFAVWLYRNSFPGFGHQLKRMFIWTEEEVRVESAGARAIVELRQEVYRYEWANIRSEVQAFHSDEVCEALLYLVRRTISWFGGDWNGANLRREINALERANKFSPGLRSRLDNYLAKFIIRE